MADFIIRVDAGLEIGFGHAIRSISLARYLRDNCGINTIFYSNPYEPLEKLYHQSGFRFYFNNKGLKETDILQRISDCNPNSTLLIDKLFPYNAEIICNIRRRLNVIMIQNECDGMFESNYAVFPSAHLSDEIIEDKRWLWSPAKILYGPEYITINEQVMKHIKECRKAKATPYISVTTGASDPKGILIQTISWLNESEIKCKVMALMGFDFQHNPELSDIIPNLRETIEVKKFNYKDLFLSRLAISAFGVTTNELIYANIPVITFGHIKKNSKGGEILERRYGCNWHLGLFEEITKEKFIANVNFLWSNNEKLMALKSRQKGLIDGKGIKRLSVLVKRLLNCG